MNNRAARCDGSSLQADSRTRLRENKLRKLISGLRYQKNKNPTPSALNKRLAFQYGGNDACEAGFGELDPAVMKQK